MKKRKISLLDRAAADLELVEKLLPGTSDDLMIDICAYHCQQCIEKVVKFAIELEGKEYSGRHDLYIVLDDLVDTELSSLVKPVISYVDGWISATRYGAGIRSSKSQVELVMGVCKDAVNHVKRKLPPVINAST